MTNPQMVAALQGQSPQAQAIQALFSQPTPQLQRIAGEVVRPPLDTFNKQPGMSFSDWYDRMLTPGGMMAVNKIPSNQRPPNVIPMGAPRPSLSPLQ